MFRVIADHPITTPRKYLFLCSCSYHLLLCKLSEVLRAFCLILLELVGVNQVQMHAILPGIPCPAKMVEPMATQFSDAFPISCRQVKSWALLAHSWRKSQWKVEDRSQTQHCREPLYCLRTGQTHHDGIRHPAGRHVHLRTASGSACGVYWLHYRVLVLRPINQVVECQMRLRVDQAGGPSSCSLGLGGQLAALPGQNRPG